jgi:threonyl-tRNA synthetase
MRVCAERIGEAMPTITLPDGSARDYEAPVTGREVAESISRGLAKKAVAVEVDGRARDLSAPIGADAAVRILTPDDAEGLKVMRHSASHVMAEALCEAFPGTRLVYGPAIEDGFYYDVDCPDTIKAEDLPRVENLMRKIIKKNTPFRRVEMTREEAAGKVEAEGNEYKLDNLKNAAGDTISFYTHGEGFEDLCAGPHVPSTGKVGHVKLTAVSGAYLHGDANEKQLTRV